ncbi:MAG: RsmB/NOP family class I SAM-dependent RNA methyltransferase, partial [Erysipelotrichaceae bacterium]|nr:RsmB/NOP family class I SAM-dependent RNA methyltransferase [Erysipelotrichaceae bacterium]
AFCHPSFNGLRVNTAKISVEQFLRISPFELQPVPWCSSGFYYDAGKCKPAKHPYYHAGLYYLQEPSAMLPGEVLPLQEGDVILDGCAAPGGKSTQIAARMPSGCLLVSNGISASRAQGLLKNLELSGCTAMLVSASEIDGIPLQFDKILIDAPCSGQGMFRRDPSLISAYQKKDGAYYSPIQKELLRKAAGMLKPGGRLVYSTCTFDVRENEEVVQHVLDELPDLHLLPVNSCEGFADGLNGLSECKRLYPHKIRGEGHFVALLAKNGCGGKPEEKYPAFTATEPFMDHMDPAFFRGREMRIGEKLLMIPDIDMPAGLRILRSGLLLGSYRKEVFEPSQALALALRKEQFDQVIDLRSEDERVIRYLKGETIDISEYGLEGWVLICTDGYPLGFGKITGGVFKNRYDRNWRYV